MGREFGATTGRARRCGWFDSVATRHATMVNGIDDLAITNLDGLDTVENIKVCVAYRHGKTQYDYMPNDAEMLAQCVPIYVEFEGWLTPTDKCKTFKQLPEEGAGVFEGDCRIDECAAVHRLRRAGARPDDFCLKLNAQRGGARNYFCWCLECWSLPILRQ